MVHNQNQGYSQWSKNKDIHSGSRLGALTVVQKQGYSQWFKIRDIHSGSRLRTITVVQDFQLNFIKNVFFTCFTKQKK